MYLLRRAAACWPEGLVLHLPASAPPGGIAEAAQKEPPKYTLDEWQAMAEAYGMSYGQYRLYVSEGWMLPPKKHPIKWPEGSKYAKKGK